MKIYTRTGDSGTSSLLGGARLPKDHAHFHAMGSVDELNAALGLARALLPGGVPPADCSRLDRTLEWLQQVLFDLGCTLASSTCNGSGLPHVTADTIATMERAIDRFQEDLPPLRAFILPGGTAVCAALHHARAVCRRAERDTVFLHHQVPLEDVVLQALNRMADLLFVLARWAAHRSGNSDVPWKPAQTLEL